MGSHHTWENIPLMSIRSCLLLALLLSMPAVTAHTAALDLPLRWQVDTKTRLYTAPTLADLDGDGLSEIVLAGMNSILAYDGEGKRLWEWTTIPRFCTYPAVLPRDGEPPLIYAADNSGTLTCLDGRGQKVWAARLSAPANWSASVVADVNRDGKPEVLQADEGGVIWAFDAVTGTLVWKAKAEGSIASSLAVGHLAGPDTWHVVAGTDAGYLLVLDGMGKPVWQRKLGGSVGTSPVIFTASDGSARIVTAADQGEVYCLDAVGNTLWRHPAGSGMDSPLSVGDINHDGQADIFLVTLEGAIQRLDENGRVVWSLDMQMRTDAPGTIADINGDDQLEYVLCTHKGRLLVLNGQGEILLNRQFLSRGNSYNATPALGRISKRSKGLDLLVCGSDISTLFCFGTPASANAQVQWGTYRRTIAMQGCWPGTAASGGAMMGPENLDWQTVYVGQGVRFRTMSPGATWRKPARAEAACIAPDGARYAVTADMRGERGEVVLPLQVWVPGTYRFHWSLVGNDGKPLASGERALDLVPWRNERGLVAGTAADLRAAAFAVRDNLPSFSLALLREARNLEASGTELVPVQEQALREPATRPDAAQRTAQVVARALRLQQVARLAARGADLPAGTSVLAFGGPLWESLGVADLVPATPSPFSERRRVVPGEHEPVVINLLNITDRELQVRPVVEASEGVTVRALRARAVPTSAGLEAWDALPELDSTGALSIPSLSNGQLWLDLAIGAQATGERVVKVRLQALNGAGVVGGPGQDTAVSPPETQAEVALEVLPFKMAPSGSFRLCTWAYVESSPFKDIADATYRDLWEHGNNVFFLPYGEATYDQEGKLTGPVDYSKLDQAVARFQGMDVVLLFSGYPALKPADGKDQFGSPAYRTAIKAYLADMVTHMRSWGFPPEHWALYPIDEAGGTGWDSIKAQAEFGKVIREASQEVKIYADPGGPDIAMMEMIAPYVDFWSPGVNLLNSLPEHVEVMRKSGGEVWAYNCSYNNYDKLQSAGRSLKAGDVVSEYRVAAIFAFRHRLTGTGFWTSVMTGGEDMWGRTRTEYALLYPGTTGPVDSRRWEAVREGVEDYRILAALRRRLETQPALAPATAARVRALLDQKVPAFIDNLTDEAGMDALRREMMECVREVCAQ